MFKALTTGLLLSATKVSAVTIYEGRLKGESALVFVNAHDNSERPLEAIFSTHPFKMDGDMAGSGGILDSKIELCAQDLKFLFSEERSDELIGIELLLSGNNNEFIGFLIYANRKAGNGISTHRVGNNRALSLSIEFKEPKNLKPIIDDVIFEAEEVNLNIDFDRRTDSAKATATFGLPGSRKHYRLQFNLF